MSDATVRFDVEGGLARITLDRPESMNGITNQMMRELVGVLQAVAADRSIRVLVLTGEGRAFCPGADLKHYRDGGSEDRLSSADFVMTTLLHEMPAVTVAAINGACAGAGLGWALACDLRLMSDAAKLNTAFLDVAVAGDMAIPWSLSRLIGASRARALSFMPRKLDAAEALDLGIVASVFPAASFRADVEDVVATLLKKSPTALLGLKGNYVAAERMSLADFVEYEAERHLRISASSDTAEAFRAFLEKREPNFGN